MRARDFSSLAHLQAKHHVESEVDLFHPRQQIWFEAPMSDLDRRALQANFDAWKHERAPNETEGTAFELYALEQILKSADVSDYELDSGHSGGSDNGGANAMYFFVDDKLIYDNVLPVGKAKGVELVVIQAKRAGGFSEIAVEKLHSYVRDALDYDVPVDKLVHLNTKSRESIQRFRDAYDAILSSAPAFKLSCYYATGDEAAANSKVLARVERIGEYVRSKITHATVDFHFWDCRRLLAEVRETKPWTTTIPTVKDFTTSDGTAAVCLIRLADFADFLRDDSGGQRRHLLEANVRAYQGANVQVNKDIQNTLRSIEHDKDFWWFNNGVSILADDFHMRGATLVITRPLIVNGLQTSHEIFEYIRTNPQNDDSRNVLIRIVKPPR